MFTESLKTSAALKGLLLLEEVAFQAIGNPSLGGRSEDHSETKDHHMGKMTIRFVKIFIKAKVAPLDFLQPPHQYLKIVKNLIVDHLCLLGIIHRRKTSKIIRINPPKSSKKRNKAFQNKVPNQ
eukprot:NODE_128_length_17019_cov_0.764480.p14 type:complete len:124 gc:universal NODE_128_length_17019_cov_0.764480:11687-12058(+)